MRQGFNQQQIVNSGNYQKYIGMINKDFYIEFGKVVYAMAMADGKIQEVEKVKK